MAGPGGGDAEVLPLHRVRVVEARRVPCGGWAGPVLTRVCLVLEACCRGDCARNHNFFSSKEIFLKIIYPNKNVAEYNVFCCVQYMSGVFPTIII